MLIVVNLLLATGALGLTIESRKPGLVWDFKREISAQKKVVILATPMVTEQGSFMYAVCDNRNSLTQFIESRCNVTLEKPEEARGVRGSSSSSIRSCPIHIMPDNFEGNENLAQLSLSLLGDEKAALTWVQVGPGGSMAKLRVVDMRSCRVSDVPIPVERIRFVVPYANGLDVVIYSKTYCSSPICKVAINADGQIVSEPTEVAFRDRVNSAYAPLGPVADGSIGRGFYLANRFTADRSRLFRVSANGSAAEVTTFSIEKPFGYSAAYGLLSICDSFTGTIACRTYDASLEWRMDRTLEFHDSAARWLQPRNLKDGAVLLLTGAPSQDDPQRFDQFSVYRLEANGQKHRKRLEVDNMALRCGSPRNLRVRVLEDQLDRICFYFSCAYREADTHRFQFAFKCYPRLYFEAFVPLTNGCFLADDDHSITDFTIYG